MDRTHTHTKIILLHVLDQAQLNSENLVVETLTAMAFSFRGILGQTWKLAELQVGNQRLVREISDVREIQVGEWLFIAPDIFCKVCSVDQFWQSGGQVQ